MIGDISLIDNTKSAWFVYLLECLNSKIYTGISTNVETRFDKHQCHLTTNPLLPLPKRQKSSSTIPMRR
jgi:hypothetical protein